MQEENQKENRIVNGKESGEEKRKDTKKTNSKASNKESCSQSSKASSVESCKSNYIESSEKSNKAVCKGSGKVGTEESCKGSNKVSSEEGNKEVHKEVRKEGRKEGRGVLYQKLCEGGNLYEREVLEIMLRNAYPHLDAEPIAKRLLEQFASIAEILSASPIELRSVDGLSEQVALYLACVGKCYQLKTQAISTAVIRNVDDMRAFASARLYGYEAERLELYFLDKKGKVFKIFTYTQGLADEASIEADEFGKILSRYHPYAMFVAHNHVQTGSRPSRSDNRFTKQCQLVCSVYHVQFYDHVVVGGDGTTYSFNNQKHIERIQKDFSLEAVLSHQPEPEF